MEAKIDQYRPWHDDRFPFRGLQIMKQITMAFPEDGNVTAKTLEIHDLNTVVCSGAARGMQYLLAIEDQLQRTSGISSVKLTQVRGRAPALQFTFNIQFNGAIRAN
jgi:hypothetical protein